MVCFDWMAPNDRVRKGKSALHYRAVWVKMEKWLGYSPGCHKTSHNGKTWLSANLGLTVYLAAFKDIKRQPILS